MDRYITEKDIVHKEHLDILSSVQSKVLPGYDLGLVLYNETWYAIEKNRSIYRELLKTMPIRPCSIDAKVCGEEILTIATYLGRADHDTYWSSICDDVGVHDNIFIVYPKDAKAVIKNFDIIGFPVRLCWFVRFVKELKRINPLYNRLYLALQLVKRKWVLSKIEDMKLSPRLAMCFFDGNPDESLLMLYFKKIGAITVTNQHGQPLFRSFDYDRMNQSQILAFKCDYYLAKGNFTKKQFMATGIDESRILMLGVVGAEKINNDMIVKDTSNADRVIGLFLDSPSFPFASESNKELISITQNAAHRLNCKFFVRIHPLDRVDHYSSICDDVHCFGIYDNSVSLRELFSLCDATIIHATATYLDSYRNKVRAFKYISDVYFPISNKNDEFETEEELLSLVKSWFIEDSKSKAEYIARVYSDYSSEWYLGKTQEILTRLIK